MSDVKKIIIYTDGGARGNPGPAGAGVYITDGAGAPLGQISKFLGHQTNNWAEYEAIILGLEALKKMFGVGRLKTMEIEVRMDSQLAQRQLSGQYQIKEPTLFPQYIKVHNLRVSVVPNIRFLHIPREQNKEADRLANKAMDEGGS
jgi:ribonuclease HI